MGVTADGVPPHGAHLRQTDQRRLHIVGFPDLGDDWFFTKATGSGYLVDGRHYLAHTGVQPDVEVWLERDDVVEGKDTVVETAIRWIESWAPRRSGGRRTP